MTHYFLPSLLFLAAVSATNRAAAADAAAGREKAAACAVCHGIDGLHKVPDAPNLAGNGADYIIKQLEAFQIGARQHEQMSIIAKGLSEEDITDLAAWYASIQVRTEMAE